MERLMEKNYVIHNRNNKNLGLGNHIDKDGDLDAQYALLRNVALTGSIVNGKFLTRYNKHFKWLIECAAKGCPTCSGIFKDIKYNDYTIKPFYMKNVVKIIDDIDDKVKEKPVAKIKTKNKFDKYIPVQEVKQEEKHPLYDLIMEKFNGKLIK